MFRSLVSNAPVYTADLIFPDIGKTACITGHREKNISPYNGDPAYAELTISTAKLMLHRYIDMAVERGYTNFYSGLAMGTDLWAAEYILRKKQSIPEIKLFGAMPYLRHADSFGRYYRNILRNVELKADYLITVNDDPDITYKGKDNNRYLYRDRNMYMVDHSSLVIAFINPSATISGTSQTCNYAKRCGKKLTGFSLDDVFGIIGESGGDLEEIGREIMFMKNTIDLRRQSR